MHPIVLTVSTGRCGTTFLERSFRQSFSRDTNWISHEYLKQQVTNVGLYHRCYKKADRAEMVNSEIQTLLEKWRCRAVDGPVIDFGWTMRSLVPYFHEQLGDQFRVLHVHRHPIEVAASFKLIGSYSLYHSPQWAITPMHPQALFPQFASRWKSMTAFERCLYYWLEVNAAAIELPSRFPQLSWLQIGSTEIFRSDEALEKVVRFTGFDVYGKPLERSRERNKREVFLLERRPIQDEWKRYQRHPEVIALAEKLGYDMSSKFVENVIAKYQLPAGVMPWMRNRSRYWAVRERVGRAVREAGLR